MSHPRLDPTKKIELKEQVDEQATVPVTVPCPKKPHVYKDKFWSYIVTKDVGQTRDSIIYGRPVSDNSMNSDMEESHTLQFINFSSITVRQRGTFSQPLPVKRSLDIITNVTGKLSCTFTMVRLIIPFDRDHEYCLPIEPSG